MNFVFMSEIIVLGSNTTFTTRGKLKSKKKLKLLQSSEHSEHNLKEGEIGSGERGGKREG